MRRINNVISIFLCLLMFIGIIIIPCSVNALTSGDYEYKLYDDGTALILKYNGSATNLVIPDTIDGCAVSAIGGNSFKSSDLKEVTIPNSVTTIIEYAFSGCENLESVTFGSGLKTINDAFYGCKKLKKINITDLKAWCNVRFPWAIFDSLYNTELYLNNNKVNKLVIPNGVKRINKYAFDGFKNITGLKLADSVRTIEGNAFANCVNLKKISASSKITSIHANAFRNTYWFNNHSKGLTYIGKIAYKYKGKCPSTVKIKKGTKIISSEAFAYCKSLKKISIPNSVTRIDSIAFYYSGLKELKLGNQVNTIKKYAFYNCNIKKVTIPPSVKTIDSYALGYKAVLKDNGYYDYEDEVPIEGFKILYYKGTVGEKYAKIDKFGRKSLSSITLKVKDKSSIALASSKKAKFKSSKSSIVKVTSKGKITARKKGKAVITVKQGKKKYKYKVKVK